MNRSGQERFQVREQLEDHEDSSLEAIQGVKNKVSAENNVIADESVESKPDYESDHLMEYEVGMYEVRLIPMDDNKEVLVKTEGLSSCIAFVAFFITPEQKRFCLFSHFPYHRGDEFDKELNNPKILNSIKREFIAVLPAHLNNSREVQVLEHILDRHNLYDHPIRWLYRVNSADPKLERQNTVVEMRWKPDEEPIISYLDEGLNWTRTNIVFTDKKRVEPQMPPNGIPL